MNKCNGSGVYTAFLKTKENKGQTSRQLTEEEKQQLKQEIIIRKQNLKNLKNQIKRDKLRMFKSPQRQIKQDKSDSKQLLQSVRSASALMFNRKGSWTSAERQQKLNERINEFWNGKDRSNSKTKNQWLIMDSYAQQNFSQPVSLIKTPVRQPDNSISYLVHDANQYKYDQALMSLGKKKQENKTKLNQLYFQSQIKQLLFNDSTDEYFPVEQTMQSRKKSVRELQLNQVMYSSSLANLKSNVAKVPLQSYRSKGAETQVQSRKTSRERVQSKEKTLKSNWDLSHDSSPLRE